MIIELFYEESGEGEPVILLHGFPFNHTIWSGIEPSLAQTVHVILPDLSGFGFSPIGGSISLMSDMADDVVTLLDQLNINAAWVAGHSMGGYVALEFARRHPSRLKGLGLIASQALPDSSERKLTRLAEADAVLKDGMEPVVASMLSKLTVEHTWDAQIEKIMRQTLPQGAAAAMHGMASREDATTWLPQISVPTLILHGQADSIIPIDRALAMAELLPQSIFVQVPQVGHMPMFEAPEVTADAIKQWVTS